MRTGMPLRRLAGAADNVAAVAKVLIVVSQDYGELANAVQFGSGPGIDATVLLPARLAAANRGELSLRAAAYATVDDIVAAVDREAPGLVCLFSAYLYGVNGLLDPAALRSLLDALHRRGVVPATTDPFLGLLQSPGAAPFSERHPARAMLERHFRDVGACLAEVPHVYPVPPDPPPSVPWVAYFNPARAEPPSGRRDTWLFVIAQEDYGAQAGRMGRAAFESVLVDRLRDAVAAGRVPVLIAPDACTRALAATGRLPAQAVMVPFCSYAQFHELLLNAEYAFYWNVFTNSAAARLENGGAVFFFDNGHMAHAMPPLLALGMRTYYPHVVLPMLDVLERLDPAALAANARRLLDSLGIARARRQSQPTPAQAAARLLQRLP
jgi:hypothetical protein